MSYTANYSYQYVSVQRIKKALLWLQAYNPYYADILFNTEWLNRYEQDVNQQPPDEHTQPEEACVDEEPSHDRQTHGMFMDTCLQPVDLGQEILDRYYDTTLNIAPAEGNNPVALLTDKTNEAKSFPILFPQGGPTFHDFRNHRVTLASYFKSRIMHADGRFAHNVDYIFYAQYMTEVQMVSSSISIALRKGHFGTSPGTITGAMLNNTDTLKNILQTNDGYRFLRPIRGTPALWAGAQKDVFAMVRQLGLPTFFCSFSAADMRWENLLISMMRQEGRCDNVADLDWSDKCGLLRRNPVTAARMFDKRWRTFLKQVIQSPSQPIGKVVDFFYRVEFQQRGSPHIHAIFWIANSPQVDRDSDEEVVLFVDKYISCSLPEGDDSLQEQVSTLQTHSKKHSKSCRKKRTVCRFNFPRPPSDRSFVSRGRNTDDLCSPQDTTINHMTKDAACKLMTKVKDTVTDVRETFTTVSQLYDKLGMTQQLLETAFACVAGKTQVVLRRQPADVWVNPYNKHLLSAWNANMDIQFVVNAYACIVYIISYIAKAEREMGLILSAAHREATQEGNTDAKQAMRKMGRVYLHNRDVCAQEAVYRLLQMPLKGCSRATVYIPTGEHATRISRPMATLKRMANSQTLTNDNMWITSPVDRYAARPSEPLFHQMCLATFLSEYRVLSNSESPREKIQLGQGLGFIQKRQPARTAVVRYVRFSNDTQPEKYFQNILQLFLPYRVADDLKPPGCPTYEEFYRHGHWLLDGQPHSVKDTVDVNRQTFEKECQDITHSDNDIVNQDILEDAWCQMCPDQCLEDLECDEEMRLRVKTVDEDTDDNPDIPDSGAQGSRFEAHANSMCRPDALNLLRSLNVQQRDIFYHLLPSQTLVPCQSQWPTPFHVFITGGAGTGKTHLIKAIQYEATRLLSQVASSPDKVTVLLTAPTGIAAYSIQATTIHSTLSIGMNVKLPYMPLGEAKLSTLRTELNDLQILVIDEISMVSHNLLAYIHGRLRQIMQPGDHSPFGNVCVIAVGDFFQLSPVQAKALYLEAPLCDLWNGNFSIAQLTTIVRQQDIVFAEMLNRLRTRLKTTALHPSDIALLKNCETGLASSALHIFPTNAQVNAHNIIQLGATCPDHLCVQALDYEKNPKTKLMQLKQGHFKHVYQSILPESLDIGHGARVMLIKNIDVSDGLVNRVCGEVMNIVMNDSKTSDNTVFVKFDSDKVGSHRRTRSPKSPAHISATPIHMEEERFGGKGQLRKQFPLKLAWACTVHKVQGLTVDQAVISLKGVFAPGQSYVALSCVSSLLGLTLQDFKDSAIYCKPNIQDSLAGMASFVPISTTPTQNTLSFSIFSMNVQSLPSHLPDLTLAVQPFPYSCVAVTETWLPHTVTPDTTRIPNYTFHSMPRCKAYNTPDPVLAAYKDQQGGGVGIYCRDHLYYTKLDLPNLNIECIACHFTEDNFIVAVVYRPPNYPMTQFKTNMPQLTNALNATSNNIVMLGDFNQDLLKSTSMSTFMTTLGYSQLVSEPTTEKGTLIDHVYLTNTSPYLGETTVKPMYFSTHEAVQCLLRKRS
ncbi:uncharacterized protein [Pseudochaenichthys georgianus]|uniref:uncharacterized protein n=1 Tax=Pseudochaenichthys georgianus TaxID=52239 RepID=UPI0039C35153